MRTASNKNKFGKPLIAPIQPPRVTVSKVVRAAADRYLADETHDKNADLYELVLNEVEPALLEAVLAHTDFNQSETAVILGVNRGTLRKKLAKYGLL